MSTIVLEKTPAKTDWPVHSIMGSRINPLTMTDVVRIVAQRIDTRRQLLIGVVNAAKIVNMQRDAKLCAAVRSADLILADGMSVVWASRLLRRSIPERVSGCDLMHEMLKLAHHRHHRVYLFGATEEVNNTVEMIIRRDHPGVVIAGRRNGYYRPDEEPSVVEEISNTGADMLFVAMSPPKKEIFMAKWRQQLNVQILHGVGGTFDVMAGKTKRAPMIWQRLGMEWLYRVWQEPRRMWRRYLVTNTLFCGLVIKELARQIMGRN